MGGIVFWGAPWTVWNGEKELRSPQRSSLSVSSLWMWCPLLATLLMLWPPHCDGPRLVQEATINPASQQQGKKLRQNLLIEKDSICARHWPQLSGKYIILALKTLMCCCVVSLKKGNLRTSDYEEVALQVLLVVFTYKCIFSHEYFSNAYK